MFMTHWLVVWTAGALVAAPPTIDLKVDKRVSYRFREESQVAFTIMGQKQEEKDQETLEFTAAVGEKNAKERVPVTISVSRMTGKVVGQDTSGMIDTDNLDPSQPLPAHEFVPNIALMRKPIRLLFESNGKLVGVEGTDELEVEIGRLLEKDFAGEPEIEIVRPSYLANAREPAMRAMWSSVLMEEIPDDFQIGRPWERTEEWPLSPFEMSTKTRSVAREGSDGEIEVESKVEVPPTQLKTTKLGPLDWTYALENGSGSDHKTLSPDGWVRSSQSELDINLAGSLGFGGESVPFEMNLKLKFRLDRIDEKK